MHKKWLGLLSIVIAAPAFAGLSSVDVIDPGGTLVPGGVTRDTVTGLDWLDLSLTEPFSVAAILAGAGPGVGWINDNWRYATTAEICALLRAYVDTPSPCRDGGQILIPPGTGDLLFSFVGPPSTVFASGNFDDSADDGDPARAGLALFGICCGFLAVNVSLDNTPLSLVLAGHGHWLVREPVAIDVDPEVIAWSCPGVTTTGFDVVRGDLGPLQSNGGAFDLATSECLAADLPGCFVAYTDDPAPGSGYWFLVREVTAAGSGNYDSGGLSQVEGRDAGIAGSGFDCP